MSNLKGLFAVVFCVVVLASSSALAGFTSFTCTFPDDPTQVHHSWCYEDRDVEAQGCHGWVHLQEAMHVTGVVDSVVATGVTDEDPIVTFDKEVTNESNVAWTMYQIDLGGYGGYNAATFVAGSASASGAYFGDVVGTDKKLVFSGADPVLPGETVTLTFQVNVPTTGDFGFCLHQLVPEPATMVMLAVGGLGALARRKRN